MILILFPFTLINLVRYEWVSYGREISGLTTQLMWQDEVNCDMTTRENCLLQGLNSRDHIRFYYDDGYLGKNMPQPLQPHMEFSHRDTLFPTDYSGGMQRARAAVLLDENYTPRGKTYFSLFSKLENQKYFLQNMHRQYANYGILMMLFWITGFGKNGLLSNKIAKIHQAQNRRLILCVFLFVFTTVMRIEYFFAKFYVDKDQGGWSLWVFIAQIALKVFAKFLPACYMVHAYCGIVARLTTTHSLYKAINLGNLIFKSVWFVLAPAMFLIELKDIKFSGWHFQAAKLTEAADAMKLFYETNTANGNFEKTYSAAHFYVPDGRTANVTLNGETNFWPSTVCSSICRVKAVVFANDLIIWQNSKICLSARKADPKDGRKFWNFRFLPENVPTFYLLGSFFSFRDIFSLFFFIKFLNALYVFDGPIFNDRLFDGANYH